MHWLSNARYDFGSRRQSRPEIQTHPYIIIRVAFLPSVRHGDNDNIPNGLRVYIIVSVPRPPTYTRYVHDDNGRENKGPPRVPGGPKNYYLSILLPRKKSQLS